MANRTYRYFSGAPLYPFGYGLSYSKFSYSNLKLSAHELKAGSPMKIEASVKNVSARDGDEVVEVFLTYPKMAGAPNRALCSFARVHIAAGQTAHVNLTIQLRDLSYVTDAGERVIAPGSYTLSIGGGQPATDAAAVETRFTITGEQQLPE